MRWSMRPSGCRPSGVTLLVNTDNVRAIRFYERNGFVHAGEDVNPTSGRPVLKMEWKAVTVFPRHVREVARTHSSSMGAASTDTNPSPASLRCVNCLHKGMRTTTPHTPSNCNRASRA